MAKYTGIREESLKIKAAQDFFDRFDFSEIIGNIDFALKIKRPYVPALDFHYRDSLATALPINTWNGTSGLTLRLKRRPNKRHFINPTNGTVQVWSIDSKNRYAEDVGQKAM